MTTVSDHGRAVSELSYTAYPSGAEQLRLCAEKVAARFPVVRALAAVHRTGDLSIGDMAAVVAASSDHRDDRSGGVDLDGGLLILKSGLPVCRRPRPY